MVCCRLNGFYTAVHSDIPELHFSAPAAAHQLPLTTALQMYVCDPLLVFFPNLYHGSCRLLALIVYTNGPVAEPSNEDVAFHLVGGQRGNARS